MSVNLAVITQELSKHTFNRPSIRAPAQILPVFHHSLLYPARTGSARDDDDAAAAPPPAAPSNLLKI